MKERSWRFAGQRKDVFAPKKKMTNKELKEYIDRFPDDAEVSFLLANPQKRKFYEIVNKGVITDIEYPVLFIEVGDEHPMDEEMVRACEEDEKAAVNLSGQMDITDFPEVMP